MKRTRVIDHRGAIHRICRVSDLPEDASDALRKTVLAANVLNWRHYVLPLAAMGGVTLGFMLRRGPRNVDYLAIAIAMPTMLVFVLFVSLLLARRRARCARTACVDAGVCAACGYPVLGGLAEADGSIICPECGAAWLSGNSPEPAARPQ